MKTMMRIMPSNISALTLVCAACAALAGAAVFAPTQSISQTSGHAAHSSATAHSAAATHTATTSHAAAGHTAAGGCITLPEVSPKIPAVPAGSPCPKALYTLTTEPDIRIDYVNPVEGDLAKTLGIEPSSFTLAYIDTKIGAGEPAEPHKWYTVKYTGYLADGTVFDASDKHAETADGYSFPIGAHRVVAGWDTGFAGMRVGGKRRLFIPFQLAYGPNGHPPAIPPHAELIFDMELVSQSDSAPAPKTPPAAAMPPRPATPSQSTAPSATPNRLVPQGVSPSTPATPPANAQPATPPATESK